MQASVQTRQGKAGISLSGRFDYSAHRTFHE
jgi:hypothetical protein